MAGDLPPAGRLRATLTRVAARMTTPAMYLGVLGGMQVVLLWVFRSHYGLWMPSIATVGFLALLAILIGVRQRWRLKLCGALSLGAFVAIGPTLVGVIQRSRIGLTMEHDGLLQVESAIDRLLRGQPIYGVDWSGTPMAALPWDLTPGGNPALHHLAYFPLTVLVGVPLRALTDVFGLPFDYRLVLIGFALVGLAAIGWLPIRAERRFMVLTAVYVSPLITVYLWSGRNDIAFLAMILLTLCLLARGHPVVAGLALGVAVALKPFAWLAVPFYLLALFPRWRERGSQRERVAVIIALSLAPAATILPFLLANPSAFYTDTVLYAGGGVADAYPIAGYGLGEMLFDFHVITHRTDAFPFGVFQLAAVLPTLWVMGRTFLRRPTMARWLTGYVLSLLAFTFFARFFNDNYVGVVITLFLCVLPLRDIALGAVPVRRLTPAGQLAA